MRPLSRPLAVSLLVVAVALIVVALAGPARRAWEARERAQATERLAKTIEAERALAKQSFESDRTRIIASIRELLDKGDYKAAMTAAAPFAHVGDRELKELYSEAAGAESRRQRFDQYRALTETGCTEANVGEQVASLLALVEAPQRPPSTLVRLEGSEAREVVRSRLQAPRSDATKPAAAPDPRWVALAREQTRTRILPDYLGYLYTPSAVLCVWRVEGERREASVTSRYSMDVWLAPSPDGKRLVADPVSVRETRG